MSINIFIIDYIWKIYNLLSTLIKFKFKKAIEFINSKYHSKWLFCFILCRSACILDIQLPVLTTPSRIVERKKKEKKNSKWFHSKASRISKLVHGHSCFNLASDRDSIRDVVHRFDLLLFVLHSKKVKGIPIDILDQTKKRTSKSSGQHDHLHRSLICFAQSRFI